MEIDHNHIYRCAWNIIYEPTNADKVMVWNFEVLSDEFNLDSICTWVIIAKTKPIDDDYDDNSKNNSI
jgi:hypothetical protein